MQESFVIANAKVVTPEGVREGVSVKVEYGRIAGIGEGYLQEAREIDAGGKYLFPGFVDMHSDAIEKGIEPRPNTFFPSQSLNWTRRSPPVASPPCFTRFPLPNWR